MPPLSPHLAGAVLLLGGAAMAQQFVEFERLALPPARERTECLVAADVDNDGDPDLLIAIDGPYPGEPLQLLINDGHGRYAAAPAGALPAVSLAVRAIVPFDADGDGDLDLFLACRDFQQNRLWLNVGGGAFAAAAPGALPVALDDSRAALAGDFDRDGDLDLVVANATGTSRVLLNDGLARFTNGAALPVAAGDLIVDLVPGDVDADGDTDLLLVNALGPDRLLANGGAGSFTDVTLTRMPPDATPSTAAAALDADRDGDLDFVVVNHGATDHVLVNDGTGAFALDLFALVGSNGRGADVVAGDFDGDGDADLCIVDRAGRDALWRNDGRGTFASVTGTGWPTVEDETNVVVAFDADGDGDLDVATGGGRSSGAPGRRRLLLNDGVGAFFDVTETLWPSCDRETLAVATADLDRDGALDVLVGGIGGFLEVWFGDGTGHFAIDPSRPAPAVNGTVQAFAIGDVDGDGDQDVVVGVAGQSELLVNDGSGRLVDETAQRLPLDASDTQDVALADFDRDGDLDLMLANAGPSPLFAQQNRMFVNDGSGVFTDATATRLPVRTDFSHGLAVGDVDGDQDLDVVVGNWHIPLPPNPPQPNLLLLNDGTGALFEAPPGRLPPDLAATAAVELGDLDGNGSLDLITVHAQGSPDYFYRNDGTGSFTLVSLLPGTSSSASYDVAFGDLDDDGDLDVVIGRRDQTNILLRNDAPNGFVDISSTAQPAVVDATIAVALADVDGDQDLDILVANRSFQKDRLLVNRLRQLELPYAARLGLAWPVDIHVRGSAGPAFAFLWASPTAAPVPLRIPPFGDYQLGLLPPLELGVFLVDPLLGFARVPIVVPSDPRLVGQDLHLQALTVPSADPLDMRLTSRWRDVIRD